MHQLTVTIRCNWIWCLLENLLQQHHCLYAKIFGEYSVSVNYDVVRDLHVQEQILNWGPPTAWCCFPYERRIGELSDTLRRGKSVWGTNFQSLLSSLLCWPLAYCPLSPKPSTLNFQLPSHIILLGQIGLFESGVIDVGILINDICLRILHMHIIGYCMFKIIASYSLLMKFLLV